MIAAWMTYALVIGALLAVAALAIEHMCRLAARPTRWVWAGALGATLAFTVVAPYLSMVRGSARAGLDGLPSVAVAPVAGQEVASTSGVVAMLTEARRVVVTPLRDALIAIGHGVPARAGVGVGITWLALTALLLMMIAVVYLRFRRTRGMWPVAEVHGFRVRIAPDAGPAVMGLVRPEIVVPRWLLARSNEEQRLTVVHEGEHVRAHDHVLLAVGCVAAALLPWHPAVWWMLSRLRLSIELDCDARVLRQGAAPRLYGTLLIELAGRCAGLRVAAPALADSASHLERRLVAMKPQRHRFVRARSGVLALFAGLAVVVACETQLPTSAEVEKMDVASAEKLAHKVTFVSDSTATYWIDGVRASAEQARALGADQIAQIEFTKAGMMMDYDKTTLNAEGGAQIYITTKNAAGAPPHFVRVKAEPQNVSPLAAAHDSGTAEHGIRSSADTLRITGSKTFDGLLVIDGVVSNIAALQSLTPDKIQSIEVIKGPAATKLYSDPKAANGVIRVTTKSGATKK
ncbi:MAG TPA: M56 family metallopeptidase [Gemmatimonadaceae bacterium]